MKLLFKKIKSLLLCFLEDINLFFFSRNKKNFITNEFTQLLKNYEKKKDYWDAKAYQILKKISKFGFDNFLRFRLIKDTMFVSDENNLNKYLDLINLTRDRQFIKENSFGNPLLSKKVNFTSINKVHQFYHLKLFSKLSKKKHSDVFIEFGGGYGLLCLLAIKFFKVKKYIIFDLKPLIFLQKIYLKKILNKEEFNKILFVSKIDILKRNIKGVRKFNFFAFWSFSEIDIKMRKIFFSIIKKSNFFLIGYQSYFNKIDNLNYFEGFAKKLNNYSTIKIKHPCYKDNYYLFANR